MSDIVDRMQRRVETINRVGGDLIAKAIFIEAIAEIKHLREEQILIPIAQKLPPIDEDVIFDALIEGQWMGHEMGRWTGKYTENPDAIVMDYGDEDGDWYPCTHWHPLPPRPEIKEADNE